MKKSTKIILVITLLSTIIGVLAKLDGNRFIGNLFLAISVITWLYFIYTLIFQFINKKQML
ncbi:hypothetical protein FLBR109950_02310 [Flavobacterium branchiophilum]|uniref:Uncharacterized protein n=1 Tax=Flavobacterium branchiophilum (strain FL-15) TaxID=1034807 RepID=G2Z7F6_FLABF|nr:hypothetical protein FB1_27380 [Flavobacterium branchiophilum NBRC 15030 = ATCC 35035]CCB69061.1 Hypothetical protein FBFL15_0961 [Flavobacterium branchiophilum FL-15]